jgi:hypothetical protein
VALAQESGHPLVGQTLGRGKGSWFWLALQLVEQAKPPELLRALKHAALAEWLL